MSDTIIIKQLGSKAVILVNGVEIIQADNVNTEMLSNRDEFYQLVIGCDIKKYGNEVIDDNS